MKKLFLYVLCTCILNSSDAYSQVTHSDVFFTYGDSQIEIAPQDNRLVIPQSMPDGGFFAQANPNPGFFSEQDVGGGTGPSDIVGYNVLDDLLFWADGEFTTPKPTTEIRIINNPRSVDDVVVGTGTGEQRASFNPLENSIGQSSGEGEFHAHVDFRLEPLSTDPEEKPLPGVYGLKFSLSSNNETIQESDPFFVAFQFGVEEESFSDALDDFQQLLTRSQVPGDFNEDGVLSAADLDLLSGEVATGANSVSFDLNDDQVVDQFDHTFWVEELAGTFLGDADLDGTVQFQDFLALAAGFGGPGGWADGDFDGSGEVQFPDFLRLADNFGKGQAIATSSVPEPRSSAIPLLLVFLFAYRQQTRRHCGVELRESECLMKEKVSWSQTIFGALLSHAVSVWSARFFYVRFSFSLQQNARNY